MLKRDVTKYLFPDDLKSMSEDELEVLSYSIRDFLITKVSATGGHLAPNLGAVELTIALHRAFNFPHDSIVWDVGHQAYVHKILTGRADGFERLRQYGGMSGFPRPSESPYDIYSGGHSSTSISMAMGLAEARDLKGGNEHIVAVIGDGSMTGGPAFEGLNNAGTKRTRMIVVLNDNNMSIAHSIGSLSLHLNMLRSSTAYLEMKKTIKRRLGSSHGFGEKLLHGIEHVRDAIRYAMVEESIFEDMGFSYFGPIDGHSIPELIDILSGVKVIDGPVLVHVITEKGRGYKNAEKHPDRFHGVGPFDSVTGLPKAADDTLTWSEECGEELTRLAREDDRVIAVTAAMAAGTGLSVFAKAFPKRFFDAGIAEAHAVTFASGLATQGLRPFVALYSTFLQRAYDQLIVDVALHKLPVTFLVDRAGNVGEDGETHHGIFDISYLSHIPNMRILAPSDSVTLRGMLSYALSEDSGPIAIRYPKGTVREDITAVPKPHRPPTVAERTAKTRAMADFLKHSKSRVLREGGDATVFSVGCMTGTALEAAGILAHKGIGLCVVDVLFIKPLDRSQVINAMEHGAPIVTIEDNMLAGGFGEAVNSVLLDNNEPFRYMPRVLNMGWPDEFIPHGGRGILLQEYGLDAMSVADRILKFVKGDPWQAPRQEKGHVKRKIKG
ncbi:MAG: 1-deoxy-D-xylulose-5-phosphate synthase [Clostridiales Family XIII bacterium]|jgi:1-deoxy-D-xylulose-5-phosphate synthase|nr:1-deoxy-D-xylulose-5-phosphate synthase [Clostridiales Family XIII bacterium]